MISDQKHTRSASTTFSLHIDIYMSGCSFMLSSNAIRINLYLNETVICVRTQAVCM